MEVEGSARATVAGARRDATAGRRGPGRATSGVLAPPGQKRAGAVVRLPAASFRPGGAAL